MTSPSDEQLTDRQQALLVLLDLAVDGGWPNHPLYNTVLMHDVCEAAGKHPDAERLMAAAGLCWAEPLKPPGRRFVLLKPWDAPYWRWLAGRVADRLQALYVPAQRELFKGGPSSAGG
jgi:hypothetical protein